MLAASIISIIVAFISLINSWKGGNEPPPRRKNSIAILSFIAIVSGIIYGYNLATNADAAKLKSETENRILQKKLLEKSDSIQKLESTNYNLLNRQFDKVSDLVIKANKAAYPLPQSLKVNLCVRLYNPKYISDLDSFQKRTSQESLFRFPGIFPLPFEELKSLLSVFQTSLRIKKQGSKDVQVYGITENNLYNFVSREDFTYSLVHDLNKPYLELRLQNLQIPIGYHSATSLLDLDSSEAIIHIDHFDYLTGKKNIQEYLITHDLCYFTIYTSTISFKPILKLSKVGSDFVGRLVRL